MSSLNCPLSVLEVLFELAKAKKFHLAGLKEFYSTRVRIQSTEINSFNKEILSKMKVGGKHFLNKFRIDSEDHD